MANDNDKLVVAFYVNAAAAEAAAEDLKQWDDADDDIKLGAIGIITLNPKNGEIEVQEIGQRNTKKGALWGTAIGAAVGILSGGLALIPGMLIGAAVGGGAGALDHKALGMTDQDAEKLASHLRSGGAALGVMADDFEVEATKTQMVKAGGVVGDYELEQVAKEAVTATAAAQQRASMIVDEAVTEADDPAKKIAVVSGLAAVDAGKLNAVGIDKPSALLEHAATPQGRAELAAASGVDEETILAAVKKMDLMRVEGVGVVYADLLTAGNVSTVPDLARRNAANLTITLAEVNDTRHIAEEVPTVKMVTDWITQAKMLPRVITYT